GQSTREAASAESRGQVAPEENCAREVGKETINRSDAQTSGSSAESNQNPHKIDIFADEISPECASPSALVATPERIGQGWIRTSEGVKPADLQSAPFGHSGTYPSRASVHSRKLSGFI